MEGALLTLIKEYGAGTAIIVLLFLTIVFFLKREFKHYTRNVNRLRIDLNKSKTRCDSCKKQYDDEINKLKERLTKLNSKLENCVSDIKRLGTQFLEIEKDVKHHEKSITKVETQLESIFSMLDKKMYDHD